MRENCGNTDKTFVCNVEECNSAFRSKRSLSNKKQNKHSNKQDDVKLHGCSVAGCGTTYSWKDGQKQHIQNKHKGNTIQM